MLVITNWSSHFVGLQSSPTLPISIYMYVGDEIKDFLVITLYSNMCESNFNSEYIAWNISRNIISNMIIIPQSVNHPNTLILHTV